MQQLTKAEIRQAARVMSKEIEDLTARIDRPLRLMEVCGTHTVAVFQSGIKQLLPEAAELVSGPGCPVCVTSAAYLDQAIAYSLQSDVIITTFGDMLRVPGSASSLAAARASGADIRVVYSPLDSLSIAKENRKKTVIFLAVGFETTAPAAAATVLAAKAAGLDNFQVLSAQKMTPPALAALVGGGKANIDGLLLPGHVCAVTGLAPFAFLAEQQIPAVVTGFEALDILQGIVILLRQLVAGKAEVANQYKRVVPLAGNPAACLAVAKVYETVNTVWRGFGMLPASGLRVRACYQAFDATVVRPLPPPATAADACAAGCRCGDILQGFVRPVDCPLFGNACTPENPVGACMVSVEGCCAAWYKYGAGKWVL